MKLAVLPAIAAFAAVATCAPAFATSRTTPAKDQLSTAHQDTKFVEAANQGSFDEIDLAKLALEKSTNQDIKDFAQRMIHDHQMLIDDMKPFSNEAGIQVPSTPSIATAAEKAKLELLSGEHFDKAYIKAMVEDHHKDLEAFRQEVRLTGYPALKTAVEKGEQVVKEHLELIDQIAKKNGVAPAPVPAGV